MFTSGSPKCKAEKLNPSRSPLPNSKEREGRVTRVDGFHLGETLHSKEGLKPTRSNPTQCKIGFYMSFKGCDINDTLFCKECRKIELGMHVK